MSSIEYQKSLSKKRMGAGALLFNSNGDVLFVEPSYKPNWEIPGGVVEHNESPRECCQREIFEELGLHVEIGRLLIVDYNHAKLERLESLMFIFDGGIISDAMAQSIFLQQDELLSCRFCPIDRLPEPMTPTLRKRVLQAWNYHLCQNSNDVYWENGE